jgi:hypothetical protein
MFNACLGYYENKYPFENIYYDRRKHSAPRRKNGYYDLKAMP